MIRLSGESAAAPAACVVTESSSQTRAERIARLAVARLLRLGFVLAAATTRLGSAGAGRRARLRLLRFGELGLQFGARLVVLRGGELSDELVDLGGRIGELLLRAPGLFLLLRD